MRSYKCLVCNLVFRSKTVLYRCPECGRTVVPETPVDDRLSVKDRWNIAKSVVKGKKE